MRADRSTGYRYIQLRYHVQFRREGRLHANEFGTLEAAKAWRDRLLEELGESQITPEEESSTGSRRYGGQGGIAHPELAKRVRERRKALRMSLRQVAERAGISYATVYRLEHAKDLKVGTVLKILSAIGLNRFGDIEEPARSAQEAA